MTVVPYQPRGSSDEITRDWIALMAPAVELAKAVANTDFVPRNLRGNPAAITAAILYGDEVGLGPMQALAKIAVIEGKPTLAAEAQRALILAAGHDLWIEDDSITRVTVAGKRRDSDQTNRVTWTLDDAKRAGLAGRPAWRTYPRQMLLARASAELARAVFADAIGGLAATEELEDVPGPPPAADEGAAAVAAAAPTTRRRRRTTATATITAAPDPQPNTTTARPPLPGDEQPDEPIHEAKVTPQQLGYMLALFNEAGQKERDKRLAQVTEIIGREIDTSKDLTISEASKVIQHLETNRPSTTEQQTINELEKHATLVDTDAETPEN